MRGPEHADRDTSEDKPAGNGAAVAADRDEIEAAVGGEGDQRLRRIVGTEDGGRRSAARGEARRQFVEALGRAWRIIRHGCDVHEVDGARGADDPAGSASGLEAGRAEVDARARSAREPVGGAVDGEDRHGGAGRDVTEHIAVQESFVQRLAAQPQSDEVGLRLFGGVEDEPAGHLDAEADGPAPGLRARRLDLRLDPLQVRAHQVALLSAGRERDGAAGPVRRWRLRNGGDGDGGVFALGQEGRHAGDAEAAVRAGESQQDLHEYVLLPDQSCSPTESEATRDRPRATCPWGGAEAREGRWARKPCRCGACPPWPWVDRDAFLAPAPGSRHRAAGHGLSPQHREGRVTHGVVGADIAGRIHARDWAMLRRALADVPAPEIADRLTELDKPERVLLFRALARAQAAAAFAHLEPQWRRT